MLLLPDPLTINNEGDAHGSPSQEQRRFTMSPLMNVRRLVTCLVIFLIVGFGSALATKADTVTYQLNVGPTLGPGSYGTVKLTLNGSGGIDVDITLTNGAIINGGQACSICFNSSLTPDPNITISGNTLHYDLISGTPGTLHADGFGNYEYGLNYTGAGSGGGCTQCVGHVVFTVSKTVGTFGSVFDLVANSTGGGAASPFAVDIVINQGTAQQATGYVGTNFSTSPVPEPATMFLLGTGLIGIAARLRRQRKR